MFTKPAFISISGVAGSGKSTVSEYLKQYFRRNAYTANDFSFAGPLKDAACLWFGWDRKRLDSDFAYKEGATLDDGSPDPYCERLGMTRRVIMQKLGGSLRDGMNPAFWIVLADLGVHLGKTLPSDLYFMSDTRYINELEWAQSINAYRILVSRTEIARGQNPSQALQGATLTTHTTHASEREFLGFESYDEKIFNIIDQNQTQQQNINALTRHLEEMTIPAIRQRFGLIGKGKNFIPR